MSILLRQLAHTTALYAITFGSLQQATAIQVPHDCNLRAMHHPHPRAQLSDFRQRAGRPVRTLRSLSCDRVCNRVSRQKGA
eukprot:7838142-Alexandrium_andersonii.AAC.1